LLTESKVLKDDLRMAANGGNQNPDNSGKEFAHRRMSLFRGNGKSST
jgi:hypothetical protein